MNENIDHAIKAKKQAHALWKFQGRPADPCNELVINKKQTTYELRKQCRNEIAQRRINDREEIIQARVMDNKLFHKLISRQRGKLGKLIDELHVDQSSYSETNILEGWRIHFSNLAKKSNTSKFDIQYLDTVDNKQNPLQRGFTENSAPLIATLMIDEFERENKDLKKTTILGMLDAKSAFDVVRQLPAEAEIHKRAFTLFGNICRSGKNSMEWRIAERQLSIKNMKSNSWFIEIKKLCLKYDIDDPYSFLITPLSKFLWKKLISTKINSYWEKRINDESKLYQTLSYLEMSYKIGQCHPIARTVDANIRDIAKIPVRLKIATGTYILQTNRAAFNQNKIDVVCMLCNCSEETLAHFLLGCTRLEYIRRDILEKITNTCSLLFAKYNLSVEIDLLTVVVNPYAYCITSAHLELTIDINIHLEPLCRHLIYTDCTISDMNY
ncbi:unnamed protein product [Mytilus edulis]|uniref:Reverse transcriptase domain-containing protein n=1 Tax=Mytilus edulis TaxID=6550 RepID=A0A8S3S124_MYTED|nr:unnamed protein product [Mytilus edulis]